MSSVVFGLMLSWTTAGGRPRSSRRASSMSQLVPEASGIVKSRRHPGIFWVHNDSGNPPLLFAIRADGQIVRQFRLDVPNIDWEDIAIDDQGHLYVGDIGNNLGAPADPRDLSHRRARPGLTGRNGRWQPPPSRAMPCRAAIDSTRKVWTMTRATRS